MKYKTKPITDEEVQSYIRKRIAIHPETNCWEWQNVLEYQGYGHLDTGTRAFKHCGTRLVHRASYFVFKSKLTSDVSVRHRCNNRSCCNPEHLEPGTNAQNMADKVEPIAQRSTAALLNLRRNIVETLAEIDAELAKRNPPS